ncbi:hypothetical protein ACFZAS_43445, partial [Streptomyces lavendulae]
YGLPQWAVDAIPTLGPGQAVWRVGPHFVDIVQTVLTDEETDLTDTSSRRRQAQQALSLVKEEAEHDDLADRDWEDEDEDQDQGQDEFSLAPPALDWSWDMPPNVIDWRHHDVLKAARDGRCGEAAELAVLGEREDIRAHGVMSDQALAWLSTRAAVADLCGSPDTATHLRATVTRMGGDVEWWHKAVEADAAAAGDTAGTERHAPGLPDLAPETPAPVPETGAVERRRRRVWPYAAVAVALAVSVAAVWQQAGDDERDAKAAAYKGKAGASLTVDSVNADLIAQWSKDRDHVIVELSAAFEPNAKYLRIDAVGQSAQSTRKDDRYTKPPELSLPVSDYLADVTVQIEVGGASWKEGTQGAIRKIRLSPSGVAYDAETGEQLPRN